MSVQSWTCHFIYIVFYHLVLEETLLWLRELAPLKNDVKRQWVLCCRCGYRVWVGHDWRSPGIPTVRRDMQRSNRTTYMGAVRPLRTRLSRWLRLHSTRSGHFTRITHQTRCVTWSVEYFDNIPSHSIVAPNNKIIHKSYVDMAIIISGFCPVY